MQKTSSYIYQYVHSVKQYHKSTEHIDLIYKNNVGCICICFKQHTDCYGQPYIKHDV